MTHGVVPSGARSGSVSRFGPGFDPTIQDVTGLIAAPFGLVDWLGIPPGTRAKRIGAIHGLGNVIVVLLFAGSWLLRREALAAPGQMALALSFIGGGTALVTGWLGGELVDRLSVGVDDGAHVDAPSSLRTPHARA